jgi:CheY-like chemotaxis protein
MNGSNPKSIHVLLVEDSPTDAKLALVALRKGKVVNEVTHVEDGEEAMEYLRHQGRYSNSTRPDLILLDLNLPKMDGREVLAELKADADLKTIPVVVLTTSKEEEDILRAYQLQANCYVTKPVNFDRFLEVVQSIEHFWVSVVVLPKQPGDLVSGLESNQA